MNDKKLSTESYKGVRDFYPEDMAIQRYIFDTWSNTAESFGFERYDASILEPAELYRAKGAENAEMVHDQTYTFTDRGDREVTLRPEMTPTVARMVAGKRRELAFPLRWYSIPNLFRYERTQRGRLREHWQLNCDIFGADSVVADVEVIALAHQLFLDFGATPDMFEIRINDRALMKRIYVALGIKEELIPAITAVNDRRRKLSDEEYRTALTSITTDEVLTEEIILILDNTDEQSDVMFGLAELGITNVVFDKSIARGFNYYTGTIFEIFDTDQKGTKRSMLGGGRYDNLTSMFGGETVSGIGFGMGDVTMRDFLETHNLLPSNITSSATTLSILPFETDFALASLKVAQQFRAHAIPVSTDIGTKKVGKKISDAHKRGIRFVVVVGEDEVATQKYILKDLQNDTEIDGDIASLAKHIY